MNRMPSTTGSMTKDNFRVKMMATERITEDMTETGRKP